MWTYIQSTGRMLRPDGTELAIGYSGNWDGIPPPGGANDHRNKSADQDKISLGPIPIGRYTIGAAYDDIGGKGPVVMPLAPDASNDMFGRSAFLIHGDRSPPRSGTASDGCIILDRNSRDAIAASTDRRLSVIAQAPFGAGAPKMAKAKRATAPIKRKKATVKVASAKSAKRVVAKKKASKTQRAKPARRTKTTRKRR